MKKQIKILAAIIIFISVIINLNNVVLATTSEELNSDSGNTSPSTFGSLIDWIKDVFEDYQEELEEKADSRLTFNPNNYKPNITEEDIPENTVSLVNRIVTTLTILGTTISIIMVVALGFKYMVGSLEERAEYKRTMLPMLIGAVMIFGTSWIVKLIYNIVRTL